MLGKQILSSKSCSLSIQTIVSVKYCSQTDKDYSKKYCKGVSSTPLLRTQTLTTGSKCSKNLVFGFLLPLVIYLRGFDLFVMSYFSYIPMMYSLESCAQDLLKGKILSRINCVLLKVQLFSRNSSGWMLLSVDAGDPEF